MLIFIPISIVGKFMNFSPSIMFILAALSIIPLAGLMGEGTEEISFYSGPKISGFLNATFGNATELIISFFALKEGLFEVVKSSISGAIIGNILNLVPVFSFPDGEAHLEEKVRGSKNLASKLVDMILEKNNGDLKDKIVTIGYGDNFKDFEKLEKELQKKNKS